MPNKANCMFFWDYDTQWGADHSRSYDGPKNWGHLEFENTERLLELLAQYDIKACFAVVGAAALPGKRPYHDPAQIRRIHSAGHEIASHSLYHDWIPGMRHQELLDTLRISKDALEQCIGVSVNTFVPPYNQPFEYPQKFAPAFSERRIGGENHITLPMLCEALRNTGYRFARVSYYPLPQYVLMRLFKYQALKPIGVERISELPCVRLNTPVGFMTSTLSVLNRYIIKGKGIVVVWAHPHSLNLGNSQDERYLIPFLERVNELRHQDKLRVSLPSDFFEVNL